MYSVTVVEDNNNKSTTYHFKKFKQAEDFLNSLRKMNVPGYYVLYFYVK